MIRRATDGAQAVTTHLEKALAVLAGIKERESEPEEQREIECPRCGFEYMHPIEVVVNRGGEITTVDHNGTTMSAGEPDGRGVSILIRFQCEDGHQSLMKVSFHKGVTMTSLRY